MSGKKKPATKSDARKTAAVAARAKSAPSATTERANGAPLFVDELEVALTELRRLSNEVIAARRELYTEEAHGRGTEVALRRELDTLRTELKTARAELEISQANANRLASRLEAAAEAEARAREAQREAEHAADRARDELLWLRREVDRRGARVAPETPHEEKP